MKEDVAQSYEHELLDDFMFGLLISDIDLNIVYRNNTAIKLIDNCSSLNLNGDKLFTKNEEMFEVFQPKIARFDLQDAITSNKKRNSNVIVNCNQTPLYMKITNNKDKNLFKFVLIELKLQIKICSSTLELIYGLTSAESRVLYYVVSGHSLIDTAQILNLSEGTVRTHMKRIFSKTNTHRQNELLHLVLKNPIWLSSNLFNQIPI